MKERIWPSGIFFFFFFFENTPHTHIQIQALNPPIILNFLSYECEASPASSKEIEGNSEEEWERGQLGLRTISPYLSYNIHVLLPLLPVHIPGTHQYPWIPIHFFGLADSRWLSISEAGMTMPPTCIPALNPFCKYVFLTTNFSFVSLGQVGGLLLWHSPIAR